MDLLNIFQVITGYLKFVETKPNWLFSAYSSFYNNSVNEVTFNETDDCLVLFFKVFVPFS